MIYRDSLLEVFEMWYDDSRYRPHNRGERADPEEGNHDPENWPDDPAPVEEKEVDLVEALEAIGFVVLDENDIQSMLDANN